MTEQLKVYQVCTPDGTIHEVHALYGFNNADKNNGSLIFRAPDGPSGKNAVIAEFNYGSWSWWRIKPSVPAPVTEEGDTYLDSFQQEQEDIHGPLGQG